MGKMSTATCPACGKAICRHDPNRVSVKVARGSLVRVVKSRRGVLLPVYAGVYRDYHLACMQAAA